MVVVDKDLCVLHLSRRVSFSVACVVLAMLMGAVVWRGNVKWG